MEKRWIWLTKWKNLYGKKIWKSEEIVWKHEGIIKKSEEFLWKKYEFVSWKVKEFIWPNDILCDVNCILSKCFQVQFWGCPGKPKFQFHILCGWSKLYIIYIYILLSVSPPWYHCNPISSLVIQTFRRDGPHQSPLPKQTGVPMATVIGGGWISLFWFLQGPSFSTTHSLGVFLSVNHHKPRSHSIYFNNIWGFAANFSPNQSFRSVPHIFSYFFHV